MSTQIIFLHPVAGNVGYEMIHLHILLFCTLYMCTPFQSIYKRAYRGASINDILVLTLEKELAFTDKIIPACLPTSIYKDYARERLKVSGWGCTAYKRCPDKLHAVKVPYAPLDICGEPKYGPLELTDNVICTGSSSPVSNDSCPGDSGGNW